MSKSAEELGVDHLLPFVNEVLRSRQKILIALAQMDVTEKYKLAVTGLPRQTDYLRENWENLQPVYEARRQILTQSLEGHPPTEDELLSDPKYRGLGGPLVVDLAELLREVPTFLKEIEERGISFESLSEDEYRERVAEIHYDNVSETERKRRPYWEKLKEREKERESASEDSRAEPTKNRRR